MSGKCYLNGILLRNMLLRNKLPRNMLLRITTVYSSMLLGQMFLSCALCQLCNKTHTHTAKPSASKFNKCNMPPTTPASKSQKNAQCFFQVVATLFLPVWLFVVGRTNLPLHAACLPCKKNTDFYIYINN